MRENMKKRIRFASVARLSFRGGNIATKVITIILSAFSFMLFALGSTGYTYSSIDYITRGYLNYCENHSYVSINKSSSDLMTAEEVERIEQATNQQFVYSSSGFNWYYFLPIVDDKMHWEAMDSYWYGLGFADLQFDSGLAGSEDDYTSVLGYSLLAGRYPTEENEIAISEVHYAIFHKYGYWNVAKNYVWTNNRYEYDETLPRGELESINGYSDILGKTFGMGDPETEEQAIEYTIVGVVDTHYDYDYVKNERARSNIAGRLLFSGKTKDTLLESGISRIYCKSITDYATMKNLVNLTSQFKEEAQGEVYPCPSDMDLLFPADGLYNEAFIALIAGCLGVFFGIFAVILNGHLTTVSLERKQKEIGILRAMGANKKAVTKIFLLEAFVTATCIFLLALFASLGLYFGWIRAWTSLENFGVSMLVYNGWTVLILAAPCYAVPLLCTIAPLRKFFKRPIIDNITGNSMKKTKKE